MQNVPVSGPLNSGDCQRQRDTNAAFIVLSEVGERPRDDVPVDRFSISQHAGTSTRPSRRQSVSLSKCMKFALDVNQHEPIRDRMADYRHKRSEAFARGELVREYEGFGTSAQFCLNLQSAYDNPRNRGKGGTRNHASSNSARR